MTSSKFRFGFPLAIVLAMASAAAGAQQIDQAPDAEITAGKVQETEVQRSYSGIPTESFSVDRPVSYGDLDLATSSGTAELARRVTATAREACEQVDTSDPIDFTDTDDFSCVKTATDGAQKQVAAAIAAAQADSATRATQAKLN